MYINVLGVQTNLGTKDISIQCSLLPTPSLCVGQNLMVEMDISSDSDTDIAMAEEYDDSDIEYKCDTDDCELGTLCENGKKVW